MTLQKASNDWLEQKESKQDKAPVGLGEDNEKVYSWSTRVREQKDKVL